MTIKLGCAAWTLMDDFAPPYEDIIRKVGELGFDGIELMLRNETDIREYWTPGTIAALKERLAEQGLTLTQLVMFQNLTGGLASLDAAEKSASIAHFRAGCGIARQLGAEFISIVAPWPETITSSTLTLPEYFYLNVPDARLPGMEDRSLPEDWRFETKYRISLPEPFDWAVYWENFVDSVKQLAAIAEEYGLKVTIENRNHTMAPHTDSLLRLFDRIPSANLGANLNTGQSFLQRECLAWSVHKYEDKLFHIHAVDGDGLACYNLPAGDGTIDFEGIVVALKELNYDGFISLEWLNDADAEKNAKRSLAYLRELLG
ncbi:sugar phosphate isomerase/epimerase family protein [Cohnella cellulosilytica]|uniref:Sugar phosphate isomerase/epimerase family protein n=1 Tax=Cohnella cellulosilytica TaxID=986710 RepID=A0ABW2FPS0_9BACL